MWNLKTIRAFIRFLFNRNAIDHIYRLENSIYLITTYQKCNRINDAEHYLKTLEQKLNSSTSIGQKCNGIGDAENYLKALEQKLKRNTSIPLLLNRNAIENHCSANPNSYSIYIAIYYIAIAQIFTSGKSIPKLLNINIIVFWYPIQYQFTRVNSLRGTRKKNSRVALKVRRGFFAVSPCKVCATRVALIMPPASD